MRRLCNRLLQTAVGAITCTLDAVGGLAQVLVEETEHKTRGGRMNSRLVARAYADARPNGQ